MKKKKRKSVVDPSELENGVVKNGNESRRGDMGGMGATEKEKGRETDRLALYRGMI